MCLFIEIKIEIAVSTQLDAKTITAILIVQMQFFFLVKSNFICPDAAEYKDGLNADEQAGTAGHLSWCVTYPFLFQVAADLSQVIHVQIFHMSKHMWRRWLGETYHSYFHKFTARLSRVFLWGIIQSSILRSICLQGILYIEIHCQKSTNKGLLRGEG